MGQACGHIDCKDPSSSQAQTLRETASSGSWYFPSMAPGHMSPHDQSINPADDTRNPFCTIQADTQSVSLVTCLGGQPVYPVLGPWISPWHHAQTNTCKRVSPELVPTSGLTSSQSSDLMVSLGVDLDLPVPPADNSQALWSLQDLTQPSGRCKTRLSSLSCSPARPSWSLLVTAWWCLHPRNSHTLQSL